jgi:prepilin-type N-terminal cleavage/methylation domain-containing protein
VVINTPKVELINNKIITNNGFTLIEAISVVAILSILAGVSIPAIGKWVKLNKISEAKALASSAALECLQAVRVGNDPSSQEISESIISNDRLTPTGYQIDSGKTKCNEFNISPIDKTDTVLYALGFRISVDGKISKLAIPASDQSSLNSCKQWAGTNCGISPEQQAEWNRLAAIAKAKSDCNKKFYDWLKNTKPNGGSGTRNRWDSKSNTCSLKTWAFEGSIQQDEDEYKAAEERAFGKACSEATTAIKKAGTQTGGPAKVAGCKDRVFYFCLGEDKATETNMNTCIAENAGTKCLADRETARTSNHEGKYGPIEGPDPCGEVKWMCNGTMVDTEASYLETDCGKIPTCPPKPPICRYVPSHRSCDDC